MNKHYKPKQINIIKLKSFLDKKPQNKSNARQPSSRDSK